MDNEASILEREILKLSSLDGSSNFNEVARYCTVAPKPELLMYSLRSFLQVLCCYDAVRYPGTVLYTMALYCTALS